MLALLGCCQDISLSGDDIFELNILGVLFASGIFHILQIMAKGV